MKYGNWNIIKDKIQEEDKKIFENYNKSLLSDYEKRKIIFNYLCDNITFDLDKLIDVSLAPLNIERNGLNNTQVINIVKKNLLENNLYNEEIIKRVKQKLDRNDIPRGRNLYKDIEDVMINHKGICNGIAQYYKLLLDLNDIYSVCVICDNMMPRSHQINLVYDKENNSYSFDDITTVVTQAATKEECFDYDYEDAKKLNQGVRPLSYNMSDTCNNDIFNTFGVILDTQAVYILVGREDTSYLKYGLEIDHNIKLPSNIESIKKKNTKEGIYENINRYKKSR